MQTEIHPEALHRFNEARSSMLDQLRMNVHSDRIQTAHTPGKQRYIAGPFVDEALALQLIVSFDENLYEINTMIRTVDGAFMTHDALLVVLTNFRDNTCRIMHKCGDGKGDLVRTITRIYGLGESTFPQGTVLRLEQWRNLVAVMLTAFAD